MKHVALVLLIVGFVHTSFADTVVRTENGNQSHIQIVGDFTGIAEILFQSLLAAKHDHFNGSYITELSGQDYHGLQWTRDPGDMNGQAYTLDFDFAQDKNLKLEIQERKAHLFFEGPIASLLFQGLYQRRMGNEKYYEMGESGRHYGDFYIKYASFGSYIQCQYNYRQELGKRIASCKVDMILDVE